MFDELESGSPEVKIHYIDLLPLNDIHAGDVNNLDFGEPIHLREEVMGDDGYPANRFRHLKVVEGYVGENNIERLGIIDIIYNLLPMINRKDEGQVWLGKLSIFNIVGIINCPHSIGWNINNKYYKCYGFVMESNSGFGWFSNISSQDMSEYTSGYKFKFYIAVPQDVQIETKEDIANHCLIHGPFREYLSEGWRFKDTDVAPIDMRHDATYYQNAIAYGCTNIYLAYYNSAKANGNNCYAFYKPVSCQQLKTPSMAYKIRFQTDDYNDIDYIVIKDRQIIEIHKIEN